ncbi:MAG TPA: serine hydrolase [Rhabdochlamydiaceae bacterium]|nr:serine hydrolase [Rhabdochlamydiaceae bacterium]
MSKKGLFMVLFGLVSLTFTNLGSASAHAQTHLETKKFEAKIENLGDIDAVINDALKSFNVPGVGVGVVVDGKVVLAKGYGLRDIAQNKPVTENTLFAIGSCSKAFTTLILGQLVDEGKISWDDPVIKHIPEFRLADEHATHHLTIRDLVTHRSGLPRYDLLWYSSTLSRADLMARLQYLEPSHDLREKFQYNNLMYAVAGILIEKVSGQTWEDAVQTRVFAPLGMDESNIAVEESQKGADFSLPYTVKDDQLQTIPFRTIRSAAPAGAINSSITDMTKWLQSQLLNEKNLVRKETLHELQSIQIADVSQLRAFDNPEDQIFNFGYGLGWVIGTYKGHYHVWHNGSIDGFYSNTALLPHDKIGIVILCNRDSDGAFLVSSLSYMILDKLLGAENTDWVSKMDQARMAFMTAAKSKKKEDEAKPATTPLRPLSDYVGTYEHPGCGTIEVNLENDGLTATCNGFPGVLQHQHYDIFKVYSKEGVINGEISSFSFINNVLGEISEVIVPLEISVPPIVFKKKPSNALLALDYLKQFEGTFEGHSMTIETHLKANQLFLNATGQAPGELVPEKPFYFTIKGVQGCTVHFIPAEDGKMSEIQVINPGGIFSFKLINTQVHGQ